MPARSKEESFALILSNLRQSVERVSTAWENISEVAQDPRTKEELEARVVRSRKVVDTLDRCLKLVVLIQDLHRELGGLQIATLRRLSILAKAADLVRLRIAEYKAFIASANISGTMMLPYCSRGVSLT
jgi:hypothetical protein